MEDGYKVQLWVFDLSMGLASTMSMSLLGKQIDGIWHTSIVVYENEYLFGGGIQGATPGISFAGNNPTRKIDLGRTRKSQPEFHAWLNSRIVMFSPDSYDFLKHNCNNFTDAASMFLLGTPIPEWITGLPEEALNTPLGAMVKPFIEQMQGTMKQQIGMEGLSGSIMLPPVKQAFIKSYPKPQVKTDIDISNSKDCPYPTLCNLQPICIGVAYSNENWQRILIKKGNFTDAQLQMLQRIVAFTKTDLTATIPSEFTTFFGETLPTVPKKALFALLSLFRNFVSQNNVSGFNFELMLLVEKRFSDKDSTLQLAFVSACASLAAQVLTDPEIAINIAFKALESSNASIRTAAASIIFNIALNLPEDSDDSQIAMVGTLTEMIRAERAASVLNRSLLALGLLIQNNETLAQLVLQMDVNLSEIQRNGTKRTTEIVRDICAILRPYEE